MSDPPHRHTPSLSILFDREVTVAADAAQPACFGDLNLDQIVAELLVSREEYDLAPFFYHPLHDVEAVRYRHHVFGDLEQESVLRAVRAFARSMRQMREQLVLVDKLSYELQQQRWFLAAVATYCEAVMALEGRLRAPELSSSGLVALRDYVRSYVRSEAFAALGSDTETVGGELGAIRYTVQIKGTRVRVSPYQAESDMSQEVERTFAKFKQGAIKDHRVGFRDRAEMNHVEAQILALVAKLYPETFAKLAAFRSRHARYLDETIGRFDREIQFYLAYLEYVEPLKSSGPQFSYPRVSARSKEERVSESFDLALAARLVRQHQQVVCNDFHLTGRERILVISGPNNGGKTTFARMFGQLHYLASLGVPVPGRDARLLLPDQIFTHFEREEQLQTLRGKFEDELVRIRGILQHATSSSVLVMNESFGSTTLRDALVVGSGVMSKIFDLDVLCVFVTFIDELSRLDASTVSMMSTVVPEDPALRTFKVLRRPADGLAYAVAIAEKYGLTYESLRGRIPK